MEVNILQSISEAYQKLLDYKYRVVIGKKGKTEEFYIIFDKDEFHHLVGLHKLVDKTEFATKKASDIFEKCLNGDYKNEYYMSSVYISQSLSRIPVIMNYDKIMQNPNKYYRFRKYNGSHIKFDYFLEFNEEVFGNAGYIFLKELKRHRTQYITISCFIRDENYLDYSKEQIKYSLMLIEREIVSTSEKVELYRFPNYKGS